MMTKSLVAVLTAVLLVGLLACKGPPKPDVADEPTKTEEEIRLEQEAAKRRDEAAALSKRAAEMKAALVELQGKAESGMLPSELQTAIGDLGGGGFANAEAAVAQLDSATGPAWDTARARASGALDGLQKAYDAASSALADWQRRAAEAQEARAGKGLPIDPETGLILGLDGGDYEPYRVSVVERVQARLRAGGHYAGAVDGTFDRVTLEAIGRVQEQAGLQVSGVPSPMTRRLLFADPATG